MITEIERKLQSLIDSAGNNISRLEDEHKAQEFVLHKDSWKTIRESQTILKRTMAELIRLRRENSFLDAVARGDY